MNSVPKQIGMDCFNNFVCANDMRMIKDKPYSTNNSLGNLEEGHVDDAGNPIITLFSNDGKLHTQYVDQVVDGFLERINDDLPDQFELQEVAYNSSEIDIKVINKRNRQPEKDLIRIKRDNFYMSKL